MVDPIVRWGFTETGATRWSNLGELDDNSILEQSRAFGMAFGVAIATETGGSRSVAGFARNDREYTDAEITGLNQHVRDLHEQTESKTGMDEKLRTELHKLSVDMTHPPTTQS